MPLRQSARSPGPIGRELTKDGVELLLLLFQMGAFLGLVLRGKIFGNLRLYGIFFKFFEVQSPSKFLDVFSF